MFAEASTINQIGFDNEHFYAAPQAVTFNACARFHRELETAKVKETEEEGGGGGGGRQTRVQREKETDRQMDGRTDRQTDKEKKKRGEGASRHTVTDFRVCCDSVLDVCYVCTHSGSVLDVCYVCTHSDSVLGRMAQCV